MVVVVSSWQHCWGHMSCSSRGRRPLQPMPACRCSGFKTAEAMSTSTRLSLG